MSHPPQVRVKCRVDADSAAEPYINIYVFPPKQGTLKRKPVPPFISESTPTIGYEHLYVKLSYPNNFVDFDPANATVKHAFRFAYAARDLCGVRIVMVGYALEFNHFDYIESYDYTPFLTELKNALKLNLYRSDVIKVCIYNVLPGAMYSIIERCCADAKNIDLVIDSFGNLYPQYSRLSLRYEVGDIIVDKAHEVELLLNKVKWGIPRLTYFLSGALKSKIRTLSLINCNFESGLNEPLKVLLLDDSRGGMFTGHVHVQYPELKSYETKLKRRDDSLHLDYNEHQTPNDTSQFRVFISEILPASKITGLSVYLRYETGDLLYPEYDILAALPKYKTITYLRLENCQILRAMSEQTLKEIFTGLSSLSYLKVEPYRWLEDNWRSFLNALQYSNTLRYLDINANPRDVYVLPKSEIEFVINHSAIKHIHVYAEGHGLEVSEMVLQRNSQKSHSRQRIGES